MPPRKKSTAKHTQKTPAARDYRHSDKKALLRPEAGAQEQFPRRKRKDPGTYRFDSSLSPEMSWDESVARSEGEALIAKILQSEDVKTAQEAARKLQALSRPFLNWSGKAEANEISVPTLPLFIHERLSTQAVLDTLKRYRRNRQGTLDLFGESDKSIGEKIRGAYEHSNGWQNRMILGDSLQVMNSLLRYESMGRQVQMVYMDPPYGIKFGGNFQPFVRKRDVKDGDDDSLSREPEMVQAYRDTWTLGTHSWLTYMRDRLLLARELLTDSGSCFVQISDENVHLVRSVMDEIFGRENFVALIPFRKKTMPLGAKLLEQMYDFILWYGKNKDTIKYRKLFQAYNTEGNNDYAWYEDARGKEHSLTKEQIHDHTKIQHGSRVFLKKSLKATGVNASGQFTYHFNGKNFPASGSGYGTTKEGINRLERENRLTVKGNMLTYKYYSDDFPVTDLLAIWTDTVGAQQKSYVVQTGNLPIQRCILMTTDPGDLVLDPTCGSGTTAYVAEQWGRRWITTDVSRVPLALARQRLLTATFPYYELKDDATGPGAGFVYQRKQDRKGEEIGGIVPHVTLKSIANNEPPGEEVLVDKPETVANTTRITGPFCVEAVLPTPLSPEAADVRGGADEVRERPAEDYTNHIIRMTEVLRLSPVIRLPGNNTLALKSVRPPAKSLALHAEAQTEDGETVAVVFGPANAAISEMSVLDAAKEARAKGFNRLLAIAFAIEPPARKTIELCEETAGIPALYVQASTDLAMSDLLKNMRASEVFSVCGLPDVELTACGKQDDGEPLYQVKLLGLDTFDPVSMETRHDKGHNVPCWMLDTDYDGQCFRAGQVFFPKTSAWDKIRNALRADFEDSVWQHLASDTSEPFVTGDNGKIAVKVIDDRGNELLVEKRIEEAEK